MDGTSVFGTRCLTGELLHSVLGRPWEPLVIGLTLGAMEVAYPIAYMGAGELRYVPRKLGFGCLEARGPIVLADDGLTPLPDLLHGIGRVLEAGASGLVLAAPWLPRSLAGELPPDAPVRVEILYDRLLPMLPLYDPRDRPSLERVGWFLDAVRNHEHRDLVRALTSVTPTDVRHRAGSASSR